MTFCLAFFLAFFLTYILTTFCLAFYPAFSLTYILTFCLARVWVQVWPTASGAGGGVHTACGAGRRGGEEEKKKEGVTPLLKSRDPHLAGGENHTIGRLHSHLRLRVLDSHEKRRKDRKGFYDGFQYELIRTGPAENR